MRILVVGAGATGGFFGGRLAAAGRDVTFLVRPARARTLHGRGLRITGLGEDTVITPRLVLAGEIDGPYDLVLVSVKATALDAAIKDMAPAVGPDTLIIPFLNGMRHLEALVAAFGEDAVLGGVAKVATSIGPDGDIVRLADLQSLEYGSRRGPVSARLADVHKELSGAGFPTALSTSIVGDMWGKWAFIAAAGAVTALPRGTVGDVVAVPGGADFAEAVIGECFAVAAAAGFPADSAFARNILIAEGSPFTSSLYRDLADGNSIEVEAIFGDLVDRARFFGISVPLLEIATLALRVYQSQVSPSSSGK
jgi:2-dehydropantoate 2-reductase